MEKLKLAINKVSDDCFRVETDEIGLAKNFISIKDAREFILDISNKNRSVFYVSQYSRYEYEVAILDGSSYDELILMALRK